MKTKPQFATALASIMFVATVGCAAFSQKTPSQLAEQSRKNADEKSFLDRMPWNKKSNLETEPYPKPAKMATTWTPDTLVQTGRVPTRGFGGRVFFYDQKSRAVPVEGTLTVHGFDDAGESQEQRVKRFEFTPEQFTRHFSQSDLGASYSIWIPWDAIGGEQRRISLVTSFRTAEGNTVQGVPATVLLPGASAESTEKSEIAKLSPQYQNYLEATRSGISSNAGLTTTTIARRAPKRTPSTSIDPADATGSQTQPVDSLASGNGTPSFEIDMKSEPVRPTVMPASAQIPVN